jgi:zinc transport system permease protein
MRNALLAALLASVACGIMGVYVVVKRITFISGAIAHTAFGGVGLGYLMRVNPILTVLPFSILSALGIGLVSRKSKLAEDTVIGIFWAVGMALGVIFIGFRPGYAPDLFGYLFGNILTVSRMDLIIMLGLDTLIILVAALFYKEFLAISFDEEYAKASGIPVDFFYLLLLCLVALTIVLLIKVVGIILVIALLTIPTAIVKQYSCCSLKNMMFGSVLLCAFFTVGGLYVSYVLNLASGATIILLSAAAFLLSVIHKKISNV